MGRKLDPAGASQNYGFTVLHGDGNHERLLLLRNVKAPG